MTLKLVITSLQDDKNRQELEFEQSIISCGRSRSCLISLEHEGISRRHFIIKYEKNNYLLIDEKSRHGTNLDGQVINPAVNYPLSANHNIQIPGFLISFSHDGEPPRLEKTSVVARKLMGKIFNEPKLRPDSPYLEDEAKIYHFIFDIEKPVILLGSSKFCDFIINQNSAIYSQHSSFIRDINGIRIIPIDKAKIAINGQALQDARVLYHGDKILIGDTTLTFYEYSEDEKVLAAESSPMEEIRPDLVIAVPKETNKSLRLTSSDALFSWLFMLTLLGLSLALYKLA